MVDIFMCGEEVESKAKVLGRLMIERTNMIAAERFPGVVPILADDSAIYLIGVEYCLNPNGQSPTERREIALCVGV